MTSITREVAMPEKADLCSALWRRPNAESRAESAFGACCPSVASLAWSLAGAGMPRVGGFYGCWPASVR
jgi:hypothetical protein